MEIPKQIQHQYPCMCVRLFVVDFFPQTLSTVTFVFIYNSYQLPNSTHWVYNGVFMCVYVCICVYMCVYVCIG